MKMSSRLFFALLVAAGLALWQGCSRVSGPTTSGNNPPLSQSEKQVESAANSFSTVLFDNVAEQEVAKNFFISPLSVSMALAMTLNGSTGQTYTAMQSTLGLIGLTNEQINQSYRNLMAQLAALDPSVQFTIANSIWYRNTFSVLDTFLNVDSTDYDAQIKPLDFSSSDAAGIINQWVSDKTNGKIPSIITPPIPAEAMMYLINALYFNGTWTYSFDSSNTRQDPFYLLTGASEDVPTMVVHDTLNYYADSLFQVVELPYGSGVYSMLILLPEGGFANAETSLDQGEVNSIVGRLKPADVQVYLPKFRLEYGTDLVPVLAKMGMGVAFGPSADFSRINPAGGLYISEVLHKTYIDVNEKGTEAAAATAVGIFATLVGPQPPQPVYLNVNKPFIFLIKENRHNTIMFMGAVVDPASN